MQVMRGDWNKNECGWISGRREGKAGGQGLREGEGRGLAHGPSVPVNTLRFAGLI